MTNEARAGLLPPLWVLIALVLGFLLLLASQEANAGVGMDQYAPGDSLPVVVATHDSTFKHVADPDSIRIKVSFRGTIINSFKLTVADTVQSGSYEKWVRAANSADSLGTYVAHITAYEGDCSGRSIQTWRVVDGVLDLGALADSLAWSVAEKEAALALLYRVAFMVGAEDSSRYWPADGSVTDSVKVYGQIDGQDTTATIRFYYNEADELYKEVFDF